MPGGERPARFCDAFSPEVRGVLGGMTLGIWDRPVTALADGLLAHLPGGTFTLDIIYMGYTGYQPPETALVWAAQACGLLTSGGLAMLLRHGAEAFVLWIGGAASLDVMRGDMA